MRNATRTAALLLAAVVLVGLAECGGGDAEQLASRPNVLLIVVDTLRADKLGSYGSTLGATPQIDGLALRSVKFDSAYAHAPWTLPSVASLLTSLYPPQHGAGGHVGGFTKLAADRRTIADSFRAAGYETAAVVNVDFLTESFGMTRGFDHVDFEVYPDNVRLRRADRTTDAALAWLCSPRTRPFLLLVHYFDPHMIYAPPTAFRERFAAPEDRDDGGWTFGTRAQIVAEREGRVRFDAATIRRAERLYDGEIAYTDHEVGRLLDAMREMGLADDTIVVFTADHGEEFWDHGGFAHGHTVYEEQVRVPLLISWPGVLAPRAVPASVGQVDVAPTLCELAGVEANPRFAGHSLAALLGGSAESERSVLHVGNFWGPPLVGWRLGDYKLILGPDRGAELYNLRHDPEERNDLSVAEAERVRVMLADLELARRQLSTQDSDSLQLTPEQEERLRALGYLD